MKKIKGIMIASFFMLCFINNAAVGQSILADSILKDTLPVYDSYLQSASINNARPFPSARVNSANIRLYAIIWRDIDLADTANNMLAIPGNSLMGAIIKGLQDGKLTPYEKDDFKRKLTAKQGELRFADSVLIPVFDKDGNQISSRMALNDFDPEKVTRFRIKEEIYFDKQRGRVDTRIFGLAPLMHISTSAELADNVAYTPAFWLYFPQLRYELVKQNVTDPDKEIFDFTMDDVFMQHKFYAYLVRESSPGGQQSGQLDRDSPEALQIEKKIASLKKHIWQNPKGINENNLINETNNKKEEKQ